MRETSSGTRKAAPIRQESGRPHVPTTVESGRTTSIMHDAPDIRIPAQRSPEPEHQPWCRSHIADDQDFGTCMSDDIVAPGQIVALIWQPGDDVTVNVVTGDRIEEATLDEVEQRALAMLTLALTGRGVTPPATALAALGRVVTS